MRFTRIIWIAPLLLLPACQREELVRHEYPIELSAGILEGGASAQTKAGEENATHNTHLALTSGTAINLQVSGTWTGHDPVAIVNTPTATVGGETGTGSKHNSLTCSPILYWEDYGSADKQYNSDGRAAGLTIYGVAINGKNAAPAVTDWDALAWTLAADQTIIGDTPADKDLIISNNVKSSTAVSGKELDTGTYKFEERGYGKLLEFQHALSKITVNLKARDGFSWNAFVNSPEVKLTSNDGSTSIPEWAYRTGTVNITTGTVTNQNNPAVITLNPAATVTAGFEVTKEALVMPGSAFSSDDAIIVRIDADGSIYYVTAEKIRTAINSSTHDTDGDYLTQPGKNYILNIIVNKTDIVVTATVTDWTNIEAEEIAPVINVSGDLGGNAGTPENSIDYSFYRSTTNKDFIGTTENGFLKEESVLSYNPSAEGEKWSMNPVLYWPNHNTHYQFRAVYPRTVTTANNDNDGVYTSPRVQSLPHDYHAIKVKNGRYDANTFPSNLQIGRPNVTDGDANCGNNEPGHSKKNLYTEGICAREGVINLTFKYMMCQVEVNLSTTATDYDKVELQHAKVELVNVHNIGYIKLGDREALYDDNASGTVYELDDYTYDSENNKSHYHSLIIPQDLTYTTTLASGNVKFRITIKDLHDTPNDTTDDTVEDIYYADINPIRKSDLSAKVAPDGKWESGVHYVYNLKVSKTEVKVTANLANWTTVTANQDVWF